ncbi:hypothetical protein ABIB10_007883 [Bradyrhizobium sp. RT3b]
MGFVSPHRWLFLWHFPSMLLLRITDFRSRRQILIAPRFARPPRSAPSTPPARRHQCRPRCGELQLRRFLRWLEFLLRQVSPVHPLSSVPSELKSGFFRDDELCCWSCPKLLVRRLVPIKASGLTIPVPIVSSPLLLSRGRPPADGHALDVQIAPARMLGRRWRHGLASSRSRATRTNVASSPKRPTI